MNTELKNILLGGYKNERISFLLSNPDAFMEAARLSITDEQPFAWRSAWLINNCMEENDERLRKFIPKITACIKSKKSGHQRELLKILMKMKLNERQEGLVFDFCMNLWEQTLTEPSVRYSALTFILKTAEKHPELKSEISCLLRDHYLASLSPGIKNSVIRMKNKLLGEKGELEEY